ncbi:MAG: hypothetical protein H7Z73_03895, partial [Candidatus Saccharibacteria bacterium]|nr:hypothetical protein [Moraxellaceae bacterium]
MLSTVNQHKDKVTTESVRSITSVSKAASRFSNYMLQEHFHSKLAMCIAVSLGVTLTGCGTGNGATTRVDETTPSKPTVSTTYNLKIQSPVLLRNTKVTVTDTSTGSILGESVIQNGNDIEFVMPLTTLRSGHLILITLSPVDSSSQYFDPMLNNQLGAMTAFNKPLHALISADMSDKMTKIDPFTEMVYERALIRSGTLDISKPKVNALTSIHLNLATNEMMTAFGTVSTTVFAVLFNNPTS